MMDEKPDGFRVQISERGPSPQRAVVCWVRLCWGACGWVATAPKAQRITTITTTTTTVIWYPDGAVDEVFWRDDSGRNHRWAVWRQEAASNFGRLAHNLWRWHSLLGFAGSVLTASQGRYLRGRIATGETTVNSQRYATAVHETRWQSTTLRSGLSSGKQR